MANESKSQVPRAAPLGSGAISFGGAGPARAGGTNSFLVDAGGTLALGVGGSSCNFDWTNGTLPLIAEPDPSYLGINFVEALAPIGNIAYIIADIEQALGGARIAVTRARCCARNSTSLRKEAAAVVMSRRSRTR
ncbi:MAG TPA: hypothetical protein VIV60_14375 [Polyangiaceae bacterium]